MLLFFWLLKGFFFKCTISLFFYFYIIYQSFFFYEFWVLYVNTSVFFLLWILILYVSFLRGLPYSKGWKKHFLMFSSKALKILFFNHISFDIRCELGFQFFSPHGSTVIPKLFTKLSFSYWLDLKYLSFHRQSKSPYIFWLSFISFCCLTISFPSTYISASCNCWSQAIAH